MPENLIRQIAKQILEGLVNILIEIYVYYNIKNKK